MPFATRNAYYLRLSAHSLLPLYVYLDDRHVEWMTNTTLQKVLADLQPLIPLKLESEPYAGPSNSKKGTVDVHRGDDYQFAFFVRKVDSQSNVLVKTRRFVPSKTVAQRLESPTPVTLGKRKRRPPSALNQALKAEPEVEANAAATVLQEGDADPEERPGGKRRVSPAGSEYREEETGDAEEDKPKMELQVSYQGFTIFGRCLCVVVEPYPPLKPSAGQKPETPPSAGRSILRSTTRFPSERPHFREETPLFLPEIEPSTREPLPSSASINVTGWPEKAMNPDTDVPEGPQAAENSGMMALTQLLQSTAMYRIDSDSDGEDAGVFLGDAGASRDIF